ncbi:MAG: permease [bacterium]|nr:permease [bacterium]
MEYISQYFNALWMLIQDLWIWFLVGFVAAGVVTEFVPRSFVNRHFGSNDLSSLVKAALSGLIASTCSCGAIPLAVSLREKGASTAVALTFLLATPWSGVPQFLVLSNFLGPFNTAILMVCAVVAALLSGVVLSRLEHHHLIDAPLPTAIKAKSNTVCTAGAGCSDCGCETAVPHNRFMRVLKSSWVIFRDIGKYLMIGLILAAGLAAFVPNAIVYKYLGESASPWTILLAVPVSAVIELCSEGFSVLAGQAYTMGATLGVVFVMLMVGVTTDITEITVVWGKFGKRSAVAYLLVSTGIAVAIAYLINISVL